MSNGKGDGNSLVGMVVGMLFLGLLLGLVIAAVVAYFVIKSPSPFRSAATSIAGSRPEASAGDAAARPVPPAPSDKPRFDFYKILPGTEEPKHGVPEPSSNVATPTPPAGVSPPSARTNEPKSAGMFYLQAGAYQTPGDADVQKAKLALLGMEASIQSVALPDKGTLYRVRLGPYDNAEEMNRGKAELAKRGIDATVIKGP